MERLELERNPFWVHCNHPIVIPHYTEWWERNWLKGTLDLKGTGVVSVNVN